MAFTAGCGGDDGPSLAGVVREPPRAVGDVSLPDAGAGGEPFRFRAEPRHLLVAYFGYTYCPDVCPTTLAHVSEALDDLGADAERVEFAMTTVDPERDTPDVLQGYVGSFVDDAHLLRTEDATAQAKAQDAFGVVSERQGSGDSYDFVHSAQLFVIDESGTVVLEWPFGTEPEAIAADLETMLARLDAGEPAVPPIES